MTDESGAGTERRVGYGEVIARLDGIALEQRRQADALGRIEKTVFIGNGQSALLSRVTALETRGAPSRTERGGVLGVAIAAAVTAVLAYLGIKPGGQQ